MIDPIDVFAKQFTPTDGGYLYYPSKRSGGKLVTADEYQRLLADWRKVAGHAGAWKIAGGAILTICLWTILANAQSFPGWCNSIMILVLIMGISAWIIWGVFAPNRLVRDRPNVAPPRPSAQASREVRSLITWRLILFMLLFSGVAFAGSLYSGVGDFARWAWSIGSGAMFVSCIWIAWSKFRD